MTPARRLLTRTALAVAGAATVVALAATGWVAGTGTSPAGPLVGATVPVAPQAPEVPAPSRAEVGVDPAWTARVAAATGIPAPAVRAYGAATLRQARTDPACRLGWTTLAGIGWVESQHGTLGGRSLRDDGRSDRLVVGPALDGVGPVAAVRPHPGWSARHGDARWEHAVGPMQFLGRTWDLVGADGDGDGTADPGDLDDAALAAARLLCDVSDLDDGPAWVRAVLAYNPSTAYVRDVHDAAEAYARQAG